MQIMVDAMLVHGNSLMQARKHINIKKTLIEEIKQQLPDSIKKAFQLHNCSTSSLDGVEFSSIEEDNTVKNFNSI